MINLNIPDADFYITNLNISVEEYQELLEKVDFKQDYITIYGKNCPIPRLTAWYGKTYSYSGIKNEEIEIPDFLLDIKSKVENVCGEFNSVLLNLYRDGKDSVAFHCDDEKELGENPIIASLSLGQSRKFHLRHKKTYKQHVIELKHGDLLLMGDNSQTNYQHSLPKDRSKNERLNLTFRNIYGNN